MRPSHRATALTACLFVLSLAPLVRAEEASPAALVDEMRRSFTIDGKAVPPEIFRDLGDGDLADSGPIWVTVDVKSAIGSNLYYDAITKNGDWLVQRKVQTPPCKPPFRRRADLLRLYRRDGKRPTCRPRLL